MKALAFWKKVTMDKADFLESLIHLLGEEGIRYAVIGGQAVNAYAEPVVSLDLDLVMPADDVARAESLFGARFRVERFPHSVNLSQAESDLRVQIQTDPRYAGFVDRSQPRDVLGLRLPVAAARDVLQGKVWAAQDPGRRPSKRLKDLSDIARLIEAQPELRALVPADLLARLG